MDCENYRLGISARLDGEDAGFDAAALAWHLASCESCRRFESEAIRLTRAVRVASTETAPDLAPTIMAAINRERVATSRRFDPQALRAGLIALAVVQMVLALPVLLLGRDAGAPVHIAREVGSFDFALAVGFLFVGWRPAPGPGCGPRSGSRGGPPARCPSRGSPAPPPARPGPPPPAGRWWPSCPCPGSGTAGPAGRRGGWPGPRSGPPAWPAARASAA